MMEQCYIKDAERREQRRLTAGVIQEAHTVTKLLDYQKRTRVSGSEGKKEEVGR